MMHFFYCSSLASITIPDSVTSIGNSAFYLCLSLESITIPDSVTSIGGCAFGNCTSLASITIPYSVTSIEGGAFCGCSRLESVYISDLADWCNINFSSYDSNPLCNAGNLYINNELATEINIPDCITSIGAYTFYGCSNLESITIPDSVTSIGEDAFYGTPLLANQTGSVYYVDKWLVDCDTDVTSAEIKEGTVGIGNYAFNDCRSLMSITIPDSVTNIGYCAFNGCSSLTSITIPDSVKNLDSAFYACFNLTKLTIKNPDCLINDYINKDSVIFGYENSTAQTYAEEHSIKFVSMGGKPNTPPVTTPVTTARV